MRLHWRRNKKNIDQETSRQVCLSVCLPACLPACLHPQFSRLLGTDTLWSAVCSQGLLPFLFPVREVGWTIALQGMPTCQMLALKG